MLAFHGKKEVKKFYLSRVKAHEKADQIVKGKYWKNGSGCGVGCTIHSSDHGQYEVELGIPEWLARVEDILFESMSNDKAKKWPAQFLSAINPGADLEQVKAPFIIMLLKHSLKSTKKVKFDRAVNPQVVAALKQSEDAVKQMISAWENNTDKNAADSAAWAASSAAWAARSAASSAAYSAESAESAESAASSAASSAAYAASSAAWAARSAASSAAYAANSAESAAYSAARSAAYEYYAAELLKLLKAAK